MKNEATNIIETVQLGRPINPNSNPTQVGYALFNNATRQQTRNLTKENKSNS